ncbi:GPI ethanolamine phosphate transferase 1 [Drosophila obscura]|uniref:GPI ethanolamine phosphate transferase 1 n=1 Tax=Drosophila obscura TaxID=7282 RepID=UPI001BB1FC98|nr:GPI ethanolamine phosphate transferase 1 [Drosophila obscura]
MFRSYYSYSLVQLLLFASVYVVYFRMTDVGVLEPQQVEPLTERVPADRLVVFVKDGLRANTFFEDYCNNWALLRQLFLKKGLVGICHPAAPIDSQFSSYVALFSGFYEDAASAVHNWLRSLAPFDSIFNRSSHSYAWTTAHMQQRFPDIDTVTVPSNEITPGLRKNSFEMEESVSRAVETFLLSESQELQERTGLLFFVHLMSGEDARGARVTSGNLKFTDINVWKMYSRFEDSFPDERTAYLLTSDFGFPQSTYGCSNKSNKLVQAPFFLWGSGVNHFTTIRGRSFEANAQKMKLPLHVLNPIQLTPLMSALLGLPPPANNRGNLPSGLLRTSSRYEANAMRTNALQVLAQARHLSERHKSGLFSRAMPAHWLNSKLMDSFVKSSLALKQQQRFKALLEYTSNYMPVFDQCINYFMDYYRIVLLVSASSALLGWVYCLRCHLERPGESADTGEISEELSDCLWGSTIISRAVTLFLVALMCLQRVPLLVQAVFLLPSLVWVLALRALKSSSNVVSCSDLMWPLVLAQISLGGFFRRYIMALGYLGFACYSTRGAFRVRGSQFYLWLLLLLVLAYISVLPESIGCSQRNILLISIPLTLVRPLAFGVCPGLITWLINGAILLAAFVHVAAAPVPCLMVLASWVFFFYIAYFQRRSLQITELIVFNLSTLYTLTCTAYESLVIQMLAMELQLGLRLRSTDDQCIPAKTAALHILIYSWYSIFVTGSIPALVVDFVSILNETCFGYNLWTSGLVLTLKMLLPWLLIVCILGGAYKDLWSQERQIFAWLMFMCSTMSVGLLLCVVNHGSGRKIGSSVAALAVVQVFPFLWLQLWRLAHSKVANKWISQLPTHSNAPHQVKQHLNLSA